MIIGITHLESVWNRLGPSEVPYLLHKPVTGQELFFAISYSKPALVHLLPPLLQRCSNLDKVVFFNSIIILSTFLQKLTLSKSYPDKIKVKLR